MINDDSNPVIVTDFHTEARNSPENRNRNVPKISIATSEDLYGTYETT